MGALQKLKSVLTTDNHSYECQDCGYTFESGVPLHQATCRECQSENVEEV